jgi:DinB superfamily
MADQALLLLLKDVRGKTLRILDQANESQARFAPPGLHNSILWHAGHSLCVVEQLGVVPATGKATAIPKEWFEKFDWNSKPATVKDWPAVSEVRAKLVEQSEKLMATINKLSEAQLSQPVGDPAKKRDLRYGILHGLHDEAGHQGEMWLLLKLQTKASAGK